MTKLPLPAAAPSHSVTDDVFRDLYRDVFASLTTKESAMETDYENPPLLLEFEKFRQQGSVVWNDQLNGWLVTGFDEADAVLRDPERFSSGSQRENISAKRFEEFAAAMAGERGLIFLSEPEHSRLVTQIRRRITASVPKWLHRLEPVMDVYIDDFFNSGGETEFRATVSELLPIAVICNILGLDHEDRAMLRQFKEWDGIVAAFSARPDMDSVGTGRQAAKEFADLLRPIVEARRENPQDDLISQLWQIVPPVLTDTTADDIIAQCRQIFIGGQHTTTFALNNCAAFLFSDAELRAELKAEPEKISIFVEEVLRILGVLERRLRVVVDDTELGGVALRKGELLFVALQAANRDAAVFAMPTSINLRKEDQKRHLTFGAGRKLCAGMDLARAELNYVVTRLVNGIGAAEIEYDVAQPEFVSENVANAWDPIYVKFEDARPEHVPA